MHVQVKGLNAMVATSKTEKLLWSQRLVASFPQDNTLDERGNRRLVKPVRSTTDYDHQGKASENLNISAISTLPEENISAAPASATATPPAAVRPQGSLQLAHRADGGRLGEQEDVSTELPAVISPKQQKELTKRRSMTQEDQEARFDDDHSFKLLSDTDSNFTDDDLDLPL